eukprot:CAMPEP_0168475966 /NCGR_PEP_ID=MMETSP0228-20121227/61643_1 /TAXON_ID=133427 /ORGANISM="Protoceratium reticulatum, Strain CCCM 535 (=CCMP 1889)" /LENGTH=33 /DNA_ID= /DNA_START= /DNA_END= /DNA_ORIENTATION=
MTDALLCTTPVKACVCWHAMAHVSEAHHFSLGA